MAPHGVPGFAFQRLFDNQPRRQPHQLRATVCHLAATFHQRLQPLAYPIRCGYSLDWGAPSSRPVAKPDLVGFAYQARVHPNPFPASLGLHQEVSALHVGKPNDWLPELCSDNLIVFSASGFRPSGMPAPLHRSAETGTLSPKGLTNQR
jgi:hypothetical protein